MRRTSSLVARVLPRNRSRVLLVWTLALVLLLVIVLKLSSESDQLARVQHVQPTSFLALFGLCAALFVAPGLIRKLMAGQLGVTLALVDWYGLFMTTNLMSLVIPARGDLAYAAYYLNAKYRLPYSAFAIMTYASAVLSVTTLAALAAIGLAFLVLESDRPTVALWSAVAAIGAIAILAVVLPTAVLRAVQKASSSHLQRAAEAWRSVRSNLRVVLLLYLLSMLDFAVFGVWMFAAYRALGFEVSLVAVLAASIAARTASVLAVTPANLGLREGALGLVSEMMGVGFAGGVLVTLLQRMVSSIVFLMLGTLFWWRGGRLLLTGREDDPSRASEREGPRSETI